MKIMHWWLPSGQGGKYICQHQCHLKPPHSLGLVLWYAKKHNGQHLTNMVNICETYALQYTLLFKYYITSFAPVIITVTDRGCLQ